MAFLTPYYILDIFTSIITIIIGFYINFRFRSSQIFAKRNIPHEEPHFILGNTKEANYTKRISEVIDEIYFRRKKEKLVGMWMYVRPAIVVTDVSVAKNIMIRDFAHFHDRGLVVNEKLEPLTGHLFNLSGQKWRNLRVKLTPTFTSGKMKMIFETMLEVGLQLQNHLELPANESQTVEMKELLASYTTDIIASVVYGIESKCLDNPDSDFRKYGRMVFSPPLTSMIAAVISFVAPPVAKTLQLRQISKAVSDFFMKVFKDVVDYREKNDLKRKDFMELLLQLKTKGYLDNVDGKESDFISDEKEKFTVEQAAAQAFIFFFAGFETSATVMIFALYEIAKNPDIQDRLQIEIDDVIKKENGELTYYGIHKMEYLDQVVQETLRKYPPVPLIFRECTKRYPVPDTNLILEQGDFIVIPVNGIQSDPDHYTDPSRFDPDRFNKESTTAKKNFTFIPFGDGPRNCIGERFGIQQVKVGLVTILTKYRIEMSEKTPVSLVLEPAVFVPSPKGGMPLRITKRV